MVSGSLLLALSGLITGIYLTLSSLPWEITYTFFSIPFIFIPKSKKGLFFSAGILLGLIISYFHIHIPENHIVNYQGKLIERAEGIITSSKEFTFSTEYIVKIYSITTEYGRTYNTTGKILLKTKENEYTYTPGSYIIMEYLFLHKIPPPENPSGFDRKKYLESKGIYLEGKAKKILIQKRTHPVILFQKIRRHIIKNIYSALLYYPEERELLKTITLGDERIPEFLKAAGIKSGTYHLLVISGLHIGFVFLFLRIIFIPLAELNNRYPKVLPSLTLLLIWFYAGITGFRIPVVRAVLMFSFFLAGEILERDISIINSILLSAFLLLVINPYNLQDISFQLSFLATLGIVLFWERFKPIERNYIKTIILTSLAAQIAVLPVLFYHFGYFYPIGLVNNIFFVPFTGIILILAFTSFILPFIFPLLRVLLTAFIRGITLTASVSPSVNIKLPIPAAIAFYGLCLLFLYAPKRKTITTILCTTSCLSLFSLFLLHKGMPENREVLYFLSLTRPSAVYINENCAVCFLADHYKTTEIQDIVIPLFSEYRVKEIVLFYTTISYNHTATFNTLKKHFKIKKVYEPECIKNSFAYPYLKIYHYNDLPELFSFLPEGKGIETTGIKIELLGEEKGTLSYIISKNNYSLLLSPFTGATIGEKLKGKNLILAYIGDLKKTKKEKEYLKSLQFKYLVLPARYKKFEQLPGTENTFYLKESAVKVLFNEQDVYVQYHYREIDTENILE